MNCLQLLADDSHEILSQVKSLNHTGRRQSKMLIVSKNVDQNSLETEFLIAICRLTGGK